MKRTTLLLLPFIILFSFNKAFAVEANFICSNGGGYGGGLFKLFYEKNAAGVRVKFFRYNETSKKDVFSIFNFQYDSSQKKLTYDRGDGKPISEGQLKNENGVITLATSLDTSLDLGDIELSYGDRSYLDFNLLAFEKNMRMKELSISIRIPKVVLGSLQYDIQSLSCTPRFDEIYKEFLISNIKMLESEDRAPIAQTMKQMPNFYLNERYDELVSFITQLLEKGASPQATDNGFSAWDHVFFGISGLPTGSYDFIDQYFDSNKKILQVLLTDKESPSAKYFGSLYLAKLLFRYEGVLDVRYDNNEFKKFVLTENKNPLLPSNPIFLELLNRKKDEIIKQVAMYKTIETANYKEGQSSEARLHLEIILALSKITPIDFVGSAKKNIDLHSEVKKEIVSATRNFCRKLNYYVKGERWNQSAMRFWDFHMDQDPVSPKFFFALKNELKELGMVLSESDRDEIRKSIYQTAQDLKDGKKDEFLVNTNIHFEPIDREQNKKEETPEDYETAIVKLVNRYSQCTENILKIILN